VVTVYSPIPFTPSDIRVFGNYSYNNQTIDVVLQHSSIENITYYEIMCYYQTKNDWKVCSNQTTMSNFSYTVWPGLALNRDYLFKVMF